MPTYSIIKQIEGSYSSDVQLIKDDQNKLWVLKTVQPEDTDEIHNEKLFLAELKTNNLNSIKLWEESLISKNQIILEFIDNSVTLGNSNNEYAHFLLGQEVKRMHDITYQDSFKIDGEGLKQVYDWKSFILEELNKGLIRAKSKNLLFSTSELDDITARFQLVSKLELTQSSLLHCDLHLNNALFQETPIPKVYLFDKGWSIFSGHPYYDLATIAIESPSLFGLSPVDPLEQELFFKFVDGYGSNFWKNDYKLFSSFVLIRALEKIGSPFNPYLPALIQNVLK